MPIKFESGILQEFFGHPIVRIDESNAEVYVVDYNVAQLHHTFYFDVAQELVSLGCSFEDPFGADSLFEIGVPCDSISRIPDGYHPGQLALGFWYGDPTERHNCTMQLLKRPDGHLKVWPACVFPERHPMYAEIWGDPSRSCAYRPRK